MTTVLEIVGLALVVVGVAMWSIPAAIITAGLLLALIGFMSEVE